MVITLSEAINRRKTAEAMMELFLSASWWEWAMIIINDVCLYDKCKPWITFAYDIL